MTRFRFSRVLPLALLLAVSPAHASQDSIVLPVTGPHTMADYSGLLNDALLALQSCNSGSVAPTNGPSAAEVDYQCWADTSAAPAIAFKRWDGAQWVTFGVLDTAAHTWTPYRDGAPIVAVATSGSAADLTTGTLPAARLPNPSASTLGGVQSLASSASKWLDSISTSGVPHASQPAFSDISGSWACSQAPALSGDISTAAGSCTTTIGAGKVTNAMLAGSIAASKLVGTDIATVGTITTGTWNGTTIAIANGGTGATSESGARTNLGVAIGSNVQAWDADLDAFALKTAPTGAVVGTSDAQTLTGKTFNCASNTCTVRLGSDVTGTLQATNFPALSGDVSTAAGSLSTTLATVNPNTGSFGGASAVPSFTVNGKGLITAASSSAYQDGTNAQKGVVKGDGTTISCSAGVCTSLGGAASSVAVGTTTVSTSTAGNCLYNNAGTLGDKPCPGTAAKSSNYTVVAADTGGTIRATASLTVSLTSAATLGANFTFDLVNASTGVITIDPNGSETINGALTLKIFPGERATVVGDGSNWQAFGLAPLVLLSSQTVSSVSAVNFVSLFDASFSSFEVRGTGLLNSTAADLTAQVSTDAGSTWLSGSTDYKVNYVLFDQGGSLSGNSINSSNITMCQVSSGALASFEMELFDLNSTTSYKTTQQRQAGAGGGGLRFMQSSARLIGANTSVVDGLRFVSTSGTVTGTFKLYGLR
jgi:hypothetical protein